MHHLVLVPLLLIAAALLPGEDSAACDEVGFGDPASEAAHRLRSEGAVAVEVLATEMGGYHDRYTVRTLQGPAAGLSLEVAAPPAGKPLLLEIEEIHDRRPDAFGYTVSANGQEVYFRTYQEYGAGPNHYFVQVPAAAIGSTQRVRLDFRSAGGPPFSLGRLWAYPDFAQVVEREGVHRPMPLFVFAKLLATPAQRQAYAGLTCYGPVGAMEFVSYGGPGIRAQNANLLRTLARSASTGLPLILEINGTGWGGKPDGPDGLGGYFSDARYSAVSFDRATGAWRASWPNMWGSMAWPTKRDPVLNAFLERRFAMAMAGFQRQLDLLRPGDPVRPELIREWGLGGGELSDQVIAKARSEGIRLDPSDGLDRDERLWLQHEAVEVWKRYAAATAAVVGRDPVVVDRGRTLPPDDHLLDHIYAQPDFLSDAPMDDPRWGGGQQGMVDGMWSSGEMGKGTEYREIAIADYLRARGKLAMVNMERTILKQDFSVLRRRYEAGFRFVALFNSEADDARLVRQVDGIDDQPAAAPVDREPSLLDVLMTRDRSPGPARLVQAIDNLVVHHDTRLAVADCAGPGSVTYRLEAPGTAFAAGLDLQVDGRISAGADDRIEVLAGRSAAELRPVAVLTARDLPCPDHWTPYMTSSCTTGLGTGMVGATSWYLRLVFHAAEAPDAAFLLGLHVGTRWPRSSGHVGGNPFTVRQSRCMQLWVQDRALAERLLGRYRSQAGEDAVARETAGLVGRGWYRSAYRRLSAAYAELQPARYAVRGHGRLGRHPVEVALPGRDDRLVVTLLQIDAGGCTFALAGEQPRQAVTLRFPELDPRLAWHAEDLGDGHYRIRTGPNEGTVQAAAIRDGQVELQLDLAAPAAPAHPLPRTLVGRYLHGDARRIAIDLQDPGLLDGESSLSFDLAPGAEMTRSSDNPAFATAAADPRPQAMDQVELSLDAQGRVARLHACYGRDRGRIKAFHPPALVGEVGNGSVELDNGNRYLLDYHTAHGTAFDMVGLQGRILDYPIGQLAEAVRPGQEVELTYCPYAGGGGSRRLLTLAQPNRVLFAEDYTASSGDAWRSRAVAVEGLAVLPHKPEPNYLYQTVMRLLRPVRAFQPGSVTYRIASDRPLGETAVEFTARAFEDSSRVEFAVSEDGNAWKTCGRFDNTWQNSYSQVLDHLPPNIIDLTPAVRGRSSFLLRMRLAVNDADERFCVGRLRVLSEGR